MAELKIGLIGIGNIGKLHANNVRNGNCPRVEIVAVCDKQPKAFDWVKSNLGEGVACYEDVDALLAHPGLDAVIVCTPHYDHPPLGSKALLAGKHVLCEKPAGVYTKQVEELNAVAAQSDRKFGIVFQQRTTPVYRKLKELLDSGELGELMRSIWIITGWFRSQSYYDSGGWRATWAGEGGGVLLNQCPHNLDLWQWLCGMPERVWADCAFGKYHDIEVEDDVTAYVQYPNGATGLFITTTGEAPGSNRLELACERGKVVVEDDKLSWWRTRRGVSDFCRNFEGGFGTPETWEVDVPVPGGGGQAHAEILNNFAAAVLDGKELIAPGIEGIRSLTLSNAMLMSAWTGGWVDLPIDGDRFKALLDERIQASSSKKDADATRTLDIDKSF